MPKHPVVVEDELSGKGGKAKAQKAASAAAKAESEARKKEEAEASAWVDGSNTRALKKAAEADKAAAEKEARKREKEELLRKEEEELASMRKAGRGTDKVATRKATKASEDWHTAERKDAPSLEARTIEDAIAVLSVATGAKGGAGGSDDDHEADLDRVAAISATLSSGATLKMDDKHPERRMKAAYKRFEERELPLLKAEFPTLRRTQINEMLWRKWGKSPENPTNAPTVKEYNDKS